MSFVHKLKHGGSLWKKSLQLIIIFSQINANDFSSITVVFLIIINKYFLVKKKKNLESNSEKHKYLNTVFLLQ